ncbi:MAG TPA: hypothetical protein VGF99_08855 [Myxococcota bacterium]
MQRRPTLAACFVVVAAFASGCPGAAEGVCGLSTVVPGDDEVASGRGTATRSDGEAFDEAGSWTANGDVTIGLLSFVGGKDEAGIDLAQLISAGSFPICQRLGDRSETVGQGIFGGLVTSATHTGALSILGLEDGVLSGRFDVEVANPAGTEVVQFTDGAFRVPQQ